MAVNRRQFAEILSFPDGSIGHFAARNAIIHDIDAALDNEKHVAAVGRPLQYLFIRAKSPPGAFAGDTCPLLRRQLFEQFYLVEILHITRTVVPLVPRDPIRL